MRLFHVCPHAVGVPACVAAALLRALVRFLFPPPNAMRLQKVFLERCFLLGFELATFLRANLPHHAFVVNAFEVNAKGLLVLEAFVAPRLSARDPLDVDAVHAGEVRGEMRLALELLLAAILGARVPHDVDLMLVRQVLCERGPLEEPPRAALLGAFVPHWLTCSDPVRLLLVLRQVNCVLKALCAAF